MPMEIIRERERILDVSYELSYRYKDIPSAGFSFPCDKWGIVDTCSMHPAGLHNYARCLDMDNPYNVVCEGVITRRHAYTQPAVGRCRCGGEVELDDPLWNQCALCGAGYNSSGQALSDPADWEEADRYDTFGPRNVKDPDEVG